MPDPLPENKFAQVRCVITRFHTRRVDKRNYAPQTGAPRAKSVITVFGAYSTMTPAMQSTSTMR